ncbi:MAG: ABC transporter ATP-binding protein [Maritimibacter sp.]|nr:ABC transporter ATP-binding protein [Maritimibacter sp.]
MTVLGLSAIEARYELLTAVHPLTLDVAEAEVVSLIGANGAGKTTLMRVLAGAHPLAGGTLTFNGANIGGLRAHERVRAGIAMAPEGRRLFADMTVRENLALAGENGRSGRWTFDTVLDALPQVAPLLSQPAGGLSGGQRQAVAIGRALMANPSLILLDEVSLGLSPAAVDLVYQSLARVRGEMTMILVEQDIARAMAFSTRVLCMAEGRLELDGAPADLTRDQITNAYFGIHTPDGAAKETKDA